MRRWGGAWLAGVLAVAALWVPAGAGAQGAAALPLTLEWIAPAACPSAAAVERHARSAVQVPEGTTLPTVHARIVVEETERGFVMRMETTRDGEVGSREVAGTSCVALAQAATLILALTFGAGVDLSATLDDPLGEAGAGTDGQSDHASLPDGELTDAHATADAARVSATADGAAPSGSADTEIDPHTEARADAASDTGDASAEGTSRLRIAGLLGLGLQVGMLPRAALSVTGGIGLGTPRIMAWAALSGLPRVQEAVPDLDVDQRYRALLAELSLCRPFVRGTVAISPCVRVSAGAIRAESVGAAQDGHARAAYVAPGLGLTLALPAQRRVAAALSLALDVPLLRPRFTLGNVGVVHRVAPWGLGVTATLLLAR